MKINKHKEVYNLKLYNCKKDYKWKFNEAIQIREVYSFIKYFLFHGLSIIWVEDKMFFNFSFFYCFLILSILQKIKRLKVNRLIKKFILSIISFQNDSNQSKQRVFIWNLFKEYYLYFDSLWKS